MKSAADLINEAKSRIRQVTPADALSRQQSNGAIVFLDVREPNEVNLGRIPGAVCIPRGILETNIEAAIPRSASVVIYCASGNRSAFVADTMQQMGYRDVASMSGGFRGWVEAGGDVDG